MSNRLPTTLVEAIRYFSDEDVCIDFVARLRWTDGIAVCPRCGSQDHAWLATRRVWKCRACKKQFSVKVGTIFEDSPIKLRNWLCAIWLIANSKNGISSHELGRAIGLTQKSAWFVLHRIRLAMRTGSFERLDGEVEVDETFIGGLGKNMHEHKRPRTATAKANKDKAIVVGARQRGGEVRASVIPDRTRRSLLPFIDQNVEPGAQIYTDDHQAYNDLRWEGYKHLSINHSKHVYVDGKITTNGIENFWALLKRGLHGTYVQVDAQHLFRYVDERLFTFNNRDMDDLGRFRTVLSRIAGRRLTYAELTS